MMPYARFLAAAEEHRYDLDRLCAAFGASSRAGRAPAYHAGSQQCARHPLLHAARRRGRQHLQALRRRGLSLLALRRHLPALESPRRLPDAGAGRHPDRRDPGRPAFLHHRRTVERAIRLDPREDIQLAIGLGCDVSHAPRIAYADGLDLAKPLRHADRPRLRASAPASAARSAPPRRPGGRSPSRDARRRSRPFRSSDKPGRS